MISLRACPFCGREAEAILIDDAWKVSCGNEFCTVYPCTRKGMPTRDEAAAQWNVRGGRLLASKREVKGA